MKFSEAEGGSCMNNYTAIFDTLIMTNKPEVDKRTYNNSTTVGTTEVQNYSRSKKNRSLTVVTNLSSRNLPEVEISLLSRGFSFIPTRSKIDHAKIHNELVE